MQPPSNENPLLQQYSPIPHSPTSQPTREELPIVHSEDALPSYGYSVGDIWGDDSNDNLSNSLPLPETINQQITSQQTGGAYTMPIQKTEESWRSMAVPLVQQLVQNNLSFALAGLPGAGKTTLLLAWLAESVKVHRNVRFYINGWKADDWLGLADLPGVYKRNFRKGNESNFDGFFEQVSAVSDVLHERLALSKNKRKGLGKVWLILDDYFATANGLSSSKKELAERWENAKAQMGEIITVGREVEVALCVATQSLNVKALGCDDANIRGCFGLCALAKIYTTENGRKEGGYSTITNLWNNAYLVPSEFKDKIVAEFNQARPVSERTGYALAFTTCGEPTIGLFTEDLSWVDDYQVPISLPVASLPKEQIKQPLEEVEKSQDALSYLKEFAQQQGLDFEVPPESI